VIKVAMKVHSNLGPGLFEEIYKVCLKHELIKAGFLVQTEVPLPLVYDKIKFNLSYRIDLIVNDSLILELKNVSKILPVHRAQLLTYLKLSKKTNWFTT
jgi:GxxExxY protein